MNKIKSFYKKYEEYKVGFVAFLFYLLFGWLAQVTNGGVDFLFFLIQGVFTVVITTTINEPIFSLRYPTLSDWRKKSFRTYFFPPEGEALDEKEYWRMCSRAKMVISSYRLQAIEIAFCLVSVSSTSFVLGK